MNACGEVVFSNVQCIAVCCSVLQCVAVYFNVVRCVAVCCSVLQQFSEVDTHVNKDLCKRKRGLYII